MKVIWLFLLNLIHTHLSLFRASHENANSERSCTSPGGLSHGQTACEPARGRGVVNYEVSGDWRFLAEASFRVFEASSPVFQRPMKSMSAKGCDFGKPDVRDRQIKLQTQINTSLWSVMICPLCPQFTFFGSLCVSFVVLPHKRCRGLTCATLCHRGLHCKHCIVSRGLFFARESVFVVFSICLLCFVFGVCFYASSELARHWPKLIDANSS